MAEETVPDANIFGIFKKKPKKTPQSTTGTDGGPMLPPGKLTQIDVDSDYYNMNHPKRGRAVIFNHNKFETGATDRDGTHKDAEDLKKVLQTFDFQVDIYTDLKYGAVNRVINDLSKEDHSDNDCLLITVLSHGDPGVVYAKDHEYPVEELWSPFAGDKCPTLAGKPKIFFIQACRGEEVDSGTFVKGRAMIETDSAPSSEVQYKIPAMADFLIMYATYEGYYAWRSSSTGSWFIQAVCKALKEYGYTRDMLHILTVANRRVAIEKESCTYPNKDLDRKKQIGMIVSTCTRLLYLNDAKNDDDDDEEEEKEEDEEAMEVDGVKK